MKDIAKLSPHHQTSSLESYQCYKLFCTQTASIYKHWNLLQVRTYMDFYKTCDEQIISKISNFYWQHCILMETVTESKPRHGMGLSI